MADLGQVTWHSSDGESGPDVGIEIDLGNGKTLYVGEASGHPGWSAVLVTASGFVPFATITNADVARDVIDALAATLRALSAKEPT